MKRVLIIENDSIPNKEIDVFIEKYVDLSDEVGDVLKEVVYAESNLPVVVASATEMSVATTEEDEFWIVVSTTMGNTDQVLSILQHIETLPVLPKFFLYVGEHFINKVLTAKWSRNVKLQEKFKYLLQKVEVYEFTDSTFPEDQGIRLERIVLDTCGEKVITI